MRTRYTVSTPAHRRKFHDSERRHEFDLQPGQVNSPAVIVVGTPSQFRGISPKSHLCHDFAAVQPGRRRKKITLVGRPLRRRAVHIEDTVRSHVDQEIMKKVRVGFFRMRHKPGQMPGQPKVIVTEKGNVTSASVLKAFVIRPPLVAAVYSQVEPMQTRVAKAGNFLFASIRAAVADDPRFEIREILSQKTL